jgi:hypothetical protein
VTGGWPAGLGLPGPTTPVYGVWGGLARGQGEFFVVTLGRVRVTCSYGMAIPGDYSGAIRALNGYLCSLGFQIMVFVLSGFRAWGAWVGISQSPPNERILVRFSTVSPGYAQNKR